MKYSSGVRIATVQVYLSHSVLRLCTHVQGSQTGKHNKPIVQLILHVCRCSKCDACLQEARLTFVARAGKKIPKGRIGLVQFRNRTCRLTESKGELIRLPGNCNSQRQCNI